MSKRQDVLTEALNALQALPEPIGGRPDIGCVVWERRPPEADHEHRGGMVVDPPDNGTVLCLQFGMARGRPRLVAHRLRLADLDPALAEPASRAKMAAAARDICRALGAGRRPRWGEEDVRWLERARDLVTPPA